jgi:hypothetical protein
VGPRDPVSREKRFDTMKKLGRVIVVAAALSAATSIPETAWASHGNLKSCDSYGPHTAANVADMCYRGGYALVPACKGRAAIPILTVKDGKEKITLAACTS